MRVVSLVPSVTETLLAWGVVPAGVTRFCEHPELPQVGGTKNPDVTAILAVEPDLVVLDREENRLEDHDALVAAGVEVLVTAVCSVADAFDATADLAAAVGVTLPDAAVPHLRTCPPCRAFVPIWRRPLMTVNAATYGASVLAHLGIVVSHADAAERYPVVELHDVAALHPDVVLLPSEPYAFNESHVAEFEPLGAPVVLVDGKDLFWWGVRTPDALGRLARRLEPVT